jgi:hypothetical protein
LLTLLGLAVLFFWRLALTNLIIGRGDIFFYFYPYRDFAAAAVRVGRVPLWNPYLFMGVPFLANSQAGFFYPLNVILSWLPVERMVSVSIVLHGAIAASGAYLWARHGLGLKRLPAGLTGVCYGLGGYFVAQVEHLNQIQVLAWLPWLLWLYDARGRGQAWRIVGLGTLIAGQFLAGHMQSVFICLVGLAAYALLPRVWVRQSWRRCVRPVYVVSAAVGLALALAAVQLLPTYRLSQLSIRSGGLPYREAVSFSLRPELVGRALLPGWGTPLFPEFVTYVGVTGLGLAVLGGLTSATDGLSLHLPAGGRLARRGALLLCLLGLFLALGGFNPLYFLLVKVVPGFDLFRAPARWLALYAVGVAGLVGLGLQRLLAGASISSSGPAPNPSSGRRRRFERSWVLGLVGAGLALAGLVLLGQVMDTPAGGAAGNTGTTLSPPLARGTVLGWLVFALLLGVGLGWYRLSPLGERWIRVGLVVLAFIVVLELWGASTFLPVNRTTAPGALTRLRPSVTHLLAEAEATVGVPAARFLSISDIFFDPGDKRELEIILEPQLSQGAVYDYLIATKQKEVLIPNLPLYYRLFAMDGYDGGVLPLRSYVTLEQLYMPSEAVAIDGRLRENLKHVPHGRWLSLFNVRFVVTDKVGDAWFDDVFYDLQMGAVLERNETVAVGHVPPMSATAIGLVYASQDAPAGTLLAEVLVKMADGREWVLPLRMDEGGGGARVARLSWGEVGTPVAVELRGAKESGTVTVQGLSLIDERIDAFWSLVISDSGHYRRVHSGDIKIYENLDVLPRAFFVPRAVTVPDDAAALALMQSSDFDPRSVVVLERESPVTALAGEAGSHNVGAGASVRVYEPERVVVDVSAPAAGWLFLSDAWYPDWQATVDGRPAPVEKADVLFRAVPVPAGEHVVEFVYRSSAFLCGAVISGAALGGLVLVLGIQLGRNLWRRGRT